MRYPIPIKRSRGFSLVEVMVAVIVISVGLLGIAKMQALSLSNTASARLRSLAAIQAASLATSMHADRAYWAAATPGLTISATGGTATTTTDATLQAALGAVAAVDPATDYCTQGAAGSATPCQPAEMAAADLQTWAADLNNLMPNSSASITCDSNPLTCVIQLSWRENLVGFNSAKATTSDAIQASDYTLYVQP
jgi:type IV pilus assembly protein PilV